VSGGRSRQRSQRGKAAGVATGEPATGSDLGEWSCSDDESAEAADSARERESAEKASARSPRSGRRVSRAGTRETGRVANKTKPSPTAANGCEPERSGNAEALDAEARAGGIPGVSRHPLFRLRMWTNVKWVSPPRLTCDAA
jgi:hypothetical protein